MATKPRLSRGPHNRDTAATCCELGCRCCLWLMSRQKLADRQVHVQLQPEGMGETGQGPSLRGDV